MPKRVREYVHHELPRNDTRTVGVYCRTCGREIARYASSFIRSIEKCKICELKEQGVLDPEEYVLNQYQLSADMNRIPVPINDEGLVEGILMLYPDEMSEQQGMLPQSGGVVGTVKAIFKAMGFRRTKEEVIAEEPASKEVARSKRGGGLYAPKKEK